MKYLFYLGHPAHFHLFKNTIYALKQKGHQLDILIKQKDVLEYLVRAQKLDYYNILPEGRKDSKAAIALGLLKRDWRLLNHCIRFRPHLMVGTSTEITHVGKLLGIPSINVNEDDWDAVPLFSKLGYPWASTILTPQSCSTGKWERKTVKYNGYHELAYLHPSHFEPDRSIIAGSVNIEKPFYVLRFAKLTAHHDEGKKGLDITITRRILELLKSKGNIYITSERELENEFEPYRINLAPEHIHHALYYASLYIGDSQTMAAESAVLGTPSVRFNDFVGKLGYLEELEKQYGLTFGIKTSQSDKLLDTIKKLINTSNIKEEWQKRRIRMLKDKIDVTAFFTWFIENFPESKTIMRENPDFQYNFR